MRFALDAFESLDVRGNEDLLRDMAEQLVLFFATRLINIDPYVREDPEERERFETAVKAKASNSVIIWGDRQPLVHVDDLLLRFAKAAVLRMAGHGGDGVYGIDTEMLSIVEPNKAFGWTQSKTAGRADRRRRTRYPRSRRADGSTADLSAA